jgi:hypothetical protein
LRDSVLAEEPDSGVKAGRTATRAFPLFSYVLFRHLDGGDLDPVIVGVTVKPGTESIKITGDISGEETGYVYFDQGCELDVPLSLEEGLRGAVNVADRLASQSHVVLAAIRSRVTQAIGKSGHEE